MYPEYIGHKFPRDEMMQKAERLSQDRQSSVAVVIASAPCLGSPRSSFARFQFIAAVNIDTKPECTSPEGRAGP